MENKSSISLSGTIILLALFPRTIFLEKKHILSQSFNHSILKRLYKLKMCEGGGMG